jgi:hypothetical protein
MRIAIGVLLSALLLLAGGVWAYDASQKEQIAEGVRIGGVDVGGRSSDEARSLIQSEVVAPLARPVLVTFEGRRFKLSAKELDQEADIDGMVDDAIEASREGGLFTRLGRYVTGDEVDADLEPRVSYSKRAVDRFVAELEAELNREPQDASVIPSGDTLNPTPGRKGIELRAGQMEELITDEVQSPAGGRSVRAVVRVTDPEVTKAELAEAYPTFLTIDRSAFTLRLFKNLKLVTSYPIAVGAVGWDTPAGLYHVQNKAVDPAWSVPEWGGALAGQVIPGGAPNNPLRERWLGIYDGAGIHGTYDTGSLGTAASHGCIRMSIPDVIELYDQVPTGTPVYIS